MENVTLRIKIKQRSNKLSSDDFDNIPCWQIAEAFNKGMVAWCRRNAHGENLLREGDEQSTSRIDDLQILLQVSPALVFTDKGDYFQSDISGWPEDYMRYKRLMLTAVNECCSEPKRFTCYLGEEANVDTYMDDVNRKPNYPWGETFFTIAGNKINVYHGGQFSIKECRLVYFRQPRRVKFALCQDVYSGTSVVPVTDVTCEFQDDIVELMIDEAAAILNGDIQNFDQMQRLSQNADKSN